MATPHCLPCGTKELRNYLCGCCGSKVTPAPLDKRLLVLLGRRLGGWLARDPPAAWWR